jgi:hypothetical protein
MEWTLWKCLWESYFGNRRFLAWLALDEQGMKQLTLTMFAVIVLALAGCRGVPLPPPPLLPPPPPGLPHP